MRCYIYKTTNFVNGKIYVGKRHCECDPFSDEKYLGSGKYFLRALKKYGRENFKKEILEEVDLESNLNEREIYWIDYFKASDEIIGYNIAKGGEGGDIVSRLSNREEIYKKQRETRKKIYEENLVKYGRKSGTFVSPRKGKKNSEETRTLLRRPRLRQSLAMKGRKKSESHRETMSLKWYSNHPLLKCPHCGKEGRVRMKATHFDNCRVVRPDYIAYVTKTETREKIRLKQLNRVKSKCIYCKKEYSQQALSQWHNEKCKHKVLAM